MTANERAEEHRTSVSPSTLDGPEQRVAPGRVPPAQISSASEGPSEPSTSVDSPFGDPGHFKPVAAPVRAEERSPAALTAVVTGGPGSAADPDTDEVPDSEVEPSVTREQKIRIIGFSTALAGVALFMVFSPWTQDALMSFFDWMATHQTEGVIVFIFVTLISVVLFVPALVMALAAGYFFSDVFGLWQGILWGWLAQFTGASLGACVAFLLGRLVLHESVTAVLRSWKHFEVLAQAIADRQLKVVVLLRLAPIAPFNMSNYLLAVTPVSFQAFALGSIGMAPGTLAMVYFGTTLRSIQEVIAGDLDKVDVDPRLQLAVTIAGIVVSVVLVVYISHIARQALLKDLHVAQRRLSAASIAPVSLSRRASDT